MRISVLASGSSGNSAYIESEEASVLIDAGLSAKETKKRLSYIGKDLSEINAIFVTHEHADHIKGLERLNNKFNIPVFMNKETYECSGLRLDNLKLFNSKAISLGDLDIQPIPTSHDAASPSGFSISSKNEKIGYFTDFGIADENIKKVIRDANSLVLETNHDIDMLLNGSYPYPLKMRILGEKGHLSNIDAGLLVKDNASEKLKNVFLAHLSKNNNREDIAYETFSKITKENKAIKLKNIMTHQDISTEIIKI